MHDIVTRPLKDGTAAAALARPVVRWCAQRRRDIEDAIDPGDRAEVVAEALSVLELVERQLRRERDELLLGLLTTWGDRACPTCGDIR